MFFFDGSAYSIIFDFSPNLPTGFITEDQRTSWNLGSPIADTLNLLLKERVLFSNTVLNKELREIGLWCAPGIIPYLLSAIYESLRKNEFGEARKTFINNCTYAVLHSWVSRWGNIEYFKKRHKLFQDSLSAHKECKYSLSISAMLPQVEGIITEWCIANLPSDQIPYRTESKAKKFRDEFKSDSVTLLFKTMFESAMDFVISGPVLATFKSWLDDVDTSFANRHVVEHGKYDESIFTEENSIKVFLMMDTLHFIINDQSN